MSLVRLQNCHKKSSHTDDFLKFREKGERRRNKKKMSVPSSMPQGAPPSTLTTILSGGAPGVTTVSMTGIAFCEILDSLTVINRLRTATAVVRSRHACSEDNGWFDAGRAPARVDSMRAGNHDGTTMRQRLSQRLCEYEVAVETGALFIFALWMICISLQTTESHVQKYKRALASVERTVDEQLNYLGQVTTSMPHQVCDLCLFCSF